MKTKHTLELVIDKISAVHGEYPGSVDVRFHYEDGSGRADGYETKRIALTNAVVLESGAIDQERVIAEVARALAK